MTSIIKLTCLSGGQDTSPSCYLLQIDQFKCLLDCGWDERFSMSIVDEISKHFRTLDAILLNYPDPRHIGALPYLIKKFGVPCPIYATRAVTMMGQMFMKDMLLSKKEHQEFDLYDLEDIQLALNNDSIKHLAFNQTHPLEGKGCGLSITPLNAGHMIGGTIWKIVKDNEEDIIYAVDYNHKKERHLNGCVLDTITRPSLLITDSYNSLNHQGRMKERDQKFLSTILETLRGGGNVLIPCDSAGRVLEVAYMLDHIWRNKESGLSAYSLAFISHTSTKMIEISTNLIEFMSDNINKEFEGSRDNPFKFKHLQLKHNMSELGLVQQPVVVLATMPDLEFGYSKDLFSLWVSEPRNSIIFTQRPAQDTLGYQLLNWSERVMEVELWHRIELQGEELEEYRRKEEEKKQLALIESQKALTINDDDSEDEYVKGKPLKSKKDVQAIEGSKHDLMLIGEKEKALFFKQARKTYPMFPEPEERKIKVDHYGEEINPNDYTLVHNVLGSDKILEIEDNKENQLARQSELEAEAKMEKKPTKCVKIVAPLAIEAKLHLFDFEGRSDGESVKNLVSQVKPRRLILVRGTPESTDYMADYCRAYVDDKIFKPNIGDVVDATTENYIYQVKLKDSLVCSLEFNSTDDGVELAWVDARTHLPDGDDINSERLPHLDLIEPDQIAPHNAILINELKLSDFKQVLLNNGIQAEFSGGILYCNDKVTVRRRETGRIHLEGTICDDYFKVRALLYKQYIIL